MYKVKHDNQRLRSRNRRGDKVVIRPEVLECDPDGQCSQDPEGHEDRQVLADAADVGVVFVHLIVK